VRKVYGGAINACPPRHQDEFNADLLAFLRNPGQPAAAPVQQGSHVDA
jgi:hypothetical protein